MELSEKNTKILIPHLTKKDRGKGFNFFKVKSMEYVTCLKVLRDVQLEGSQVDWAISHRMSSADAHAHTRAPKLITNSEKVENCASKESNHSLPHGWVAQSIYIFIKWRQLLYQSKLQYNHIESMEVWESVCLVLVCLEGKSICRRRSPDKLCSQMSI